MVAMIVTMLLASMFADELTRGLPVRTAEPPLDLPHGVDIRYSDRLVAYIGRGTPSGRARAVTLGSVIIVPRRFDTMSPEAQRRVLRHELVHVQQRDRYGRFYLPLYGLLYVMHGYSEHPLERDAVQQGGV